MKQSSAEGEGPFPDLSYRSWVEPDPVVYERLSAVTGLMLTGLDARHLLTGEQRGLLTDTKELMDFFARIAKDELAGTPIAKADNQRLAFIGDALEALWFRSSDHPTANVPSATDDDAVIADIARGGWRGARGRNRPVRSDLRPRPGQSWDVRDRGRRRLLLLRVRAAGVQPSHGRRVASDAEHAHGARPPVMGGAHPGRVIAVATSTAYVVPGAG